MSIENSDSRIDRDRIGDLLEIQKLKGHLDHKEWKEWGALFTKDARLLADNTDNGLTSTDVSEGIEDILKFVLERLTVPKSVHHGHTPLVEFDGPDKARGIWAMADIIDYGDGVLYGHGHYRETYRKEAGVWKFASVHLTRLLLGVVPALAISHKAISRDAPICFASRLGQYFKSVPVGSDSCN